MGISKQHTISTYLLVLLVPCILGFSVHAQLPQDLKITNFDGSTGFYSRVVRCFLKDEKGFLWIGTSDGLYRYDGYTFRNYRKQAGDSNSLAENYIVKLAMGKDHKIWMGTARGGLSSFDPASGKFRNYPMNYQGKAITAAVTMLVVDADNDIWLGIKEKGLWHFNPSTNVYTPYDVVTDHDAMIPKEISQKFNTVSAAIEGEKGTLWLGTYNGLYQFTKSNKVLKPIRNHPLQTNVFRDDDFISIAADGDVLWLGSWAGGLTKYNTRTNEWKNFKINLTETKKYTTNIISHVQVRSDKELWITSNDKGLGIFNKQKEQFEFYSASATHKTDIPESLCYQVQSDKYGNLWLIHEWGLTKIQPRISKFSFTPIPVTKTDNKEFYYIRDVVEDENHVYVATVLADGLHVTNKRTGVSKQFPVKIMAGEEPFLAVYKLLKDSKNRIWVISRDYIYQYNTEKEIPELIAQPSILPLQTGSNEFNNIAEDKDGKLWITTARNGVFVYDPETRQYRHFRHDPANRNSITSNSLSAVTVDQQGRIWVGGPNGCLAYYDKTSANFTNNTLMDAKSNRETGNNVYSLLADKKGHIWAGTDAGLVDINGTGKEPLVNKLYTAQEGLRGDLAYSIKEDRYGNIWCTTTSALCMVNTATQRVSSTVLQNDIIKSITARVYLAVNKNDIQVLTYGGYYSFNPAYFQDKQKDSVIAITSFRVKDKEYYYEEQLKKKGKIELDASENIFAFEFAVIDYRQSDDNQYAYMLEGFDKNWINAGNRRYAGYTNIPGGNYVFKVKALNSYGDANSSVISVPMYVSSPFYKTWWFLLFTALDVTIILYVFYRFRLRKQREILQLQTKAQALEKEKTQVQYENLKQHLNPHFLFNSLTSLSSLIRLDQKLAGEFLDGMSRIYRYILQSKDSELVLLKDEIRFIETFINLQKTRFREGLIIQLNINQEDNHYKIVPVTLQNLIENAIKHNIIDDESPLVIDIFIEGEYLFVRNNLQKKKFVETSNKQGLNNLLSLYKYLSDKPMLIEETETHYTVKIPLL